MTGIRTLCVVAVLCTAGPARADEGRNLMFSTLMGYGGLSLQLDVPSEIRNYVVAGIEWEVVFLDAVGVFVNFDFLLPAELVTYGDFGLKYHLSKPGVDWDPYVGLGVGFTAGGTITYSDGITSEIYAYPTFSFVLTGGATYWFSDSLGFYTHARVHLSGGLELGLLAGGLSVRLFELAFM